MDTEKGIGIPDANLDSTRRGGGFTTDQNDILDDMTRHTDAQNPFWEFTYCNPTTPMPAGTFLDTQMDLIANAVVQAVAAALPTGLIVMWSGLLVNIPVGWHLCDGAAGTPDLRSSFIKGAAAGVNPGVTGGANTHKHSVTATGTNAGGAVDAHAGTGVGNHVFTQPSAHTNLTHSTATDSNTSGGTAKVVATTHTISAHAGGAVDAHAVTQPNNHTFTQPTFTGNAVDSSTVNNEPVYYSLAFIMKS